MNRQLLVSPGYLYFREQKRLWLREVFRCVPAASWPPAWSSTSGAHQEHISRTGQDRHIYAAQEGTRTWEERSKRVWKAKRNCFLKVFIYKLPPGQTQSCFIFLGLWWDPSLCLSLGEPKGKTLVMRNRAIGLEKVQLESLP